MQRDNDELSTDKVEIISWNDGKKIKKNDLVIKESNVSVKIDGKDYYRFSCSPSHFKYLASGIFITEGFDPDLIEHVDISKEGKSYILNITTKCQIFRLDSLDCADNNGICRTKPKKITSQITIPKNLVLDLVKKLDDKSFSFKKTGGTHVVGIYYEETFMAVEDISRHAAIDKAIGLSFLNGINPSLSVIVVSCRQTGSIMNKIVTGGFPIVIGLSAPTDSAIDVANDFNITLIGFASKNRFNIYTNDWRVDF